MMIVLLAVGELQLVPPLCAVLAPRHAPPSACMTLLHLPLACCPPPAGPLLGGGGQRGDGAAGGDRQPQLRAAAAVAGHGQVRCAARLASEDCCFEPATIGASRLLGGVSSPRWGRLAQDRRVVQAGRLPPCQLLFVSLRAYALPCPGPAALPGCCTPRGPAQTTARWRTATRAWRRTPPCWKQSSTLTACAPSSAALWWGGGHPAPAPLPASAGTAFVLLCSPSRSQPPACVCACFSRLCCGPNASPSP